MKDLSSIIVSIFKRKGGEGKYTKLVDNVFSIEFFGKLLENEKALIYYKEENDFVLITNIRLISNDFTINYSDLNDVILAMQEEFKANVLRKSEFTTLKLKDSEGKVYLLKLEKGKPYYGIYQVLEFIALRNQKEIF